MLRKPLLTTHDVAALLKVKEATIRRWIRDGDLPALHIGREWRIAAIQIEEFLKVRATVVPPVSKGSTEPSLRTTGTPEKSHPRTKLSSKRNNR